MRKILISLLMMISATTIMAQSGMHINELFDGRYRKQANASEMIMKYGQLENYDLDIYRSITITGDPSAAKVIAPLVMKDGSDAKRNVAFRKVNYRQGELYYAFYAFKEKSGDYRYIVYLNQHLSGGNKIMVMYMAGDATPSQVMKMIKNKN